MGTLLTVEEASDALSKYTQAAIAAKEASDLLLKAQKEANELAYNQKVSDRNRLAVALHTQEMVAGLLAVWPQFQLFMEGFGEWQKEDTRWKERIEEYTLLLATGSKNNGNKARIEELRVEMAVDHAQRLLMIEQENYNQAKEKAAQYGLDVPQHVMNEVKRAERETIRLQGKLEALK